ncbi:hypothetical protein HHK36_029579 [Tetracentron sinense]|uniref:Titin-like n=1 Tax=Tetracentron sinense TaxID=13715 RepID=A0A834YFF9_TETSI|nr:hypothetical protein HHK36_029579 [Tetracentron sinense]
MEEEAKELRCGQFDMIGKESSLQELHKVEAGLNLPPETVENSTKTEESQVSTDIKNEPLNPVIEGKIGTSEGEIFLESPSLAKVAFEETCTESEDGQAHEVSSWIEKNKRDNETKLQKDQKAVEKIHVTERDNIDAFVKQVSVDMSLKISKEEVELMEDAELPLEEENIDEYMGEKLPHLPITPALVEPNLHEGKMGSVESEDMEQEKQREKRPTDKSDTETILETSLQKSKTKEVNLKVDEVNETPNEEESPNQDVETTVDQQASTEENLQSIEVEKAASGSQKDEIGGKKTGEDTDLESREQVLETIEATSGHNQQAPSHTPDFIGDRLNADVGTVTEACNNVESLDTYFGTDTAHIKQDVEETNFQGVEGNGPENSSNLVGMEKGPENIKPSQKIENEKQEWEEISQDSIRASSVSTDMASPNIQNDEEILEKGVGINDKLDSRMVTIVTEKTSLQKVEPEISGKHEEVSSLALEEKSQETVDSNEKMKDKIPIEDEIQDKINPKTPTQTTRDTCPGEGEKLDWTEASIKENKNKEGFPVTVAEDIIDITDIIMDKENIEKGGVEESELLQKDEPERDKLERSMKEMHEDIEIAPSSADAEKNTRVKEEPIKNHEESFKEEKKRGETNDTDETEDKIPKGEDLKPVDLSGKIERMEVEIPNKNTDDLPITHLLVEETAQKVGKKSEDVFNLEPEEQRHDENGASPEEEKHIEEASEVSKSMQSTTFEQEKTTDEESTLGFKLQTNEIEVEKQKAASELDSEEKLESPNAGENIEEALIKKEGTSDADLHKIETKCDETEKRTIEEEDPIKNNITVRDGDELVEKIHRKNEKELNIVEEAAPELNGEDQSYKTYDVVKTAKNESIQTEVYEAPKIASASEDTKKQIIEEEGTITDLSPESIGEESVKSSQEEPKEAEKPKGEVYEELETDGVGDDIEEHIIEEDDVVKAQSAVSIGEEKVKESSQEDEKQAKMPKEQMSETLKTASTGEGIEKQILEEDCSVKGHFEVFVREEKVKESSPEDGNDANNLEGEVSEELETAVAAKDTEKQIQEIGTVKDHSTVSIGEETVKESSQENENQLQKDQTAVEEMHVITERDNIGAFIKQVSVDMSLKNSKEDVELMEASKLPLEEENIEEYMGEKLPYLPITPALVDTSIQEGEMGSGESEIMELEKQREKRTTDNIDTQTVLKTSLQKSKTKEVNLKVDEVKETPKEEEIPNQDVETIVDQQASTEESVQSIEAEKAASGSQKDDIGGKKTAEDTDLESREQVLETIEATSGQNQQAPSPTLDIIGDRLNADVGTVTEACNNGESIDTDFGTNTAHIKQDVEETSFKGVEGNGPENSSNLVGMEKGPETINPSEKIQNEKQEREEISQDSTRASSISMDMASSNIQNDEELLEKGVGINDKLDSPSVTMVKECTSLQKVEPEIGWKLEEASSLALEEKGQQKIDSSEKMKDDIPIEDEIQDKNPETLTQTPQDTYQGDGENLDLTEASIKENKDKEGFPVAVAEDIIDITDIVKTKENIEKGDSNDVEEPELLQKDETERNKLERSLNVMHEDIETAPSSADTEKSTVVKEEPIKNLKESFKEERKEDETNDTDETKENKIPKGEDLKPVDLSEKIDSTEAEIPNKNTDDLPITHLLVEETAQKVGKKSEDVFNFEPEERHEENGASPEEEKHIEEASEVSKSMESTTFEQEKTTDEEPTLGLNLQTSEMEVEKLKKASELDSEEKLESINAGENTEEELIKKEETSDADLHKIETKCDETEKRTIEEEGPIKDYIAVCDGDELVKKSHQKNEKELNSVEEATLELDGEDQSYKTYNAAKTAKNESIQKEVYEGPQIASISEDTKKQNIEEEGTITGLSPESIGEESVKSSQEEQKEAEKPKGEVYEEFETDGTVGDDMEEHKIEEDDAVKDQSAVSIGEEKVKESSREEEKEVKMPEERMSETLKTASSGEGIEKQILEEDCVVKGHFAVSIGEETVKESSPKDGNDVNDLEGKVFEELETAGAAKDTVRQIQEIGTVKDHSTVSTGEETVKESSQENETQLQKDQTAVEEIYVITERDNIDAFVKQVSVDMSLKNSKEDVELMEASELPLEEENIEEYMGEKLPHLPITPALVDPSLQEGEKVSGESEIMEQEKQREKRTTDNTDTETVIETSLQKSKTKEVNLRVDEVNETPKEEEIPNQDVETTGNLQASTEENLQSIEAEKAASGSQKDEIGGKKTAENTELESREQVLETIEGTSGHNQRAPSHTPDFIGDILNADVGTVTEACNNGERIDTNFGTNTAHIKQDVEETSFQGVEGNGPENSSNLVGMEKGPETINPSEQIENEKQEREEISQDSIIVSSISIDMASPKIQNDEELLEKWVGINDKLDSPSVTMVKECTSLQKVEPEIGGKLEEVSSLAWEEKGQEKIDLSEKMEDDIPIEDEIKDKNNPETPTQTSQDTYQGEGENLDLTEASIKENKDEEGFSVTVTEDIIDITDVVKTKENIEKGDSNDVEEPELLQKDEPKRDKLERSLNVMHNDIETAPSSADTEKSTRVKEEPIKNLEEKFKEERKEDETNDTDDTKENKIPKGEVQAFTNVASALQDLKPVDLSEKKESMEVEIPNKNTDDLPITHLLVEETAQKIGKKSEEVFNFEPEEQGHEENRASPEKEKHIEEASEVSKSMESTIFEQEKTTDGEPTLGLTLQTSEMEVQKLKKASELDSEENLKSINAGENIEEELIKIVGSSDADLHKIETKCDEIEKRTIEEEGSIKDYSTVSDGDEMVEKSHQKNEKVQNSVEETAPELNSEDQSYKTYDASKTAKNESIHKEVYEGPKIASTSEDTKKQIMEEEGTLTGLSPESIGEESVKSSQEEQKEADKPKGEVYEELETAGVVDDIEENIIEEDDAVKDQSAVSIGEETFQESSQENEKEAKMPEDLEYMSETLKTANSGEGIKKQILEEDCAVKGHFAESVGEEIVKESSPEDGKDAKDLEGEVFEELETAGAAKDTVKQIQGIGTVKDHSTVSIGEETVKESSQEDEPPSVLQVSEERETDGAGEDTEKQIIKEDGTIKDLSSLNLGEETIKENYQEDEKEAKRLKGEVKDSDLVSIEKNFEATGSTEETEKVTLKNEENPNKNPDIPSNVEASGEEILPKESSEKAAETSCLVSEVSKKQNIEEILEKAETTSDKLDTASVTGVTEETSLQETEPEGKELVGTSDLASQEKGLETIETRTSLQGEDAKSVKIEEISKNVDKEILTAEKPEADEAEQEIKYEVLAGDRGAVLKSEDQGVETTTETEIATGKTPLDDKLQENLQGSSTLLLKKQEQDSIDGSKKIRDETQDENPETPFVSHTIEEMSVHKEEEPRNPEEVSEVGFEDIGKETPNEELQKDEYLEKNIYESKESDAMLEREKTTELTEASESSIWMALVDEEMLELGLEKNILEGEKPFDEESKGLETMGACADTEKDILEQEDSVKTPEECFKESMNIEDAAVELEAVGHSHETNEVADTTNNQTLPVENLEAIDPSKRLEKDFESMAEDPSSETLPETKETKIEENSDAISDQKVVSIENQMIGETFQKETKERIEETEPKLQAEDQSNKTNQANESTKNTILNEEEPQGVEKVDESEKIKKQIIEEEEATKVLETTGACANTEEDMLKKEDFVKNLEDNFKECMETEDTVVELEAKGHSHKNNEASDTTNNETLLVEDLEAINSGEKLERTSESMAKEKSNETIPKIKKAKIEEDNEAVTDQKVLSVENQIVGERFQEEERGRTTETEPKLEAEDHGNKTNMDNESTKNTILTEEEVKKADECDNIKKHIPEEKEAPKGLETTGACADIEKDILEQEDSIKNFEYSFKEGVEVEDTIVELGTDGQSYETNEASNTINNQTLLIENIKAIYLGEKLKRGSESMAEDQSNETLLETKETKIEEDNEVVKDQKSMSVEKQMIGERFQEEEKWRIEETVPKLEAKDQSKKPNHAHKSIRNAILSEEVPKGVEIVDESENIEKQIMREEAAKDLETIVECADTEKDNLEDNFKECTEIEDVAVDLEAKGHSHETNETSDTTNNETLLVEVPQEVEKVYECENIKKYITKEEETPEGLETTGACADIKKDIIEQEDSIKNLEDSFKEGLKVENAAIELGVEGHSHETNEASETMKNNQTLLVENIEVIYPGEKLESDSGSMAEDQSNETLPETTETKIEGDNEAVNNQRAVSLENQMIGERFQEEEKGRIEETKPKLEAEDQTNKTNHTNESIQNAILSKEVPKGIEKVDESENIKKQITEEEEAAKGLETIVECADTEKDVLKQEDLVKSLEDNFKECTETEDATVELEAKGHSYETDEASNTTNNETLLVEDLEVINLGEKFKRTFESMAEEKSNETIPKIKDAKIEEDNEAVKDQKAVYVGNQMIGKRLQEEGGCIKETEPKLEAGDQCNKTNIDNESTKNTILIEKVPQEVEKVDECENIQKHITGEEEIPEDLESPGACADIKKDILEQEDSGKNLKDLFKEGVKVKDATVELGAEGQSHETNEAFDTINNQTLLIENIEAIYPGENLERDFESMVEDQSNETLPETKETKIEDDKEAINDQKAMSVENQMIGERFQEEVWRIEETKPKLEAEDQTNKTHHANESIKDAILSEEVLQGIEKADESEKIKKQITKEEEASKGLEKIVECANTEKEILKQEYSIKNLEDNFKECMETKDAAIELEVEDHSHETNEASDTTNNESLVVEDLEAINPGEKLERTSESMAEEKSNETIPEIREAKIEENNEDVKDQNVVTVDNQVIGERLQEEERERTKETKPKLEAEDYSNKTNKDNESTTNTILIEEVPQEVEKVDECENIKKNIIEEEEAPKGLETSGACVDIGNDILKQEHSVKNLKDSFKEGVKIEDAVVELGADGQSYETNEASGTINNQTLLVEILNVTNLASVKQNIEAIYPGEKQKRDFESMAEDQSIEALAKTKETKIEEDSEAVKDQKVVFVENQMMGERFQEENGRNEETIPKLEEDGQTSKTNHTNENIKNTILSEEVPQGIENVDESENIKKQITKEEGASKGLEKIVECSDTEKDILKQKDFVKNLTEDAVVELEAEDHSHKTNEAFDTTNNEPLLVEVPQEVEKADECENINKHITKEEEALKGLETTGACADIEKDIIEQEDSIKNLEDSFKEGLKVENAAIELGVEGHSHETNEASETMNNQTLLVENIEAVYPGEKLESDSESMAEDQSNETLPETKETKIREDREAVKDQEAMTVENQMIGERFQKEEKWRTEQTETKLEAKDHSNKTNNANESIKKTSLTEEAPRGVEEADESENIKKQIIEKEVLSKDLHTVSIGEETVNEVRSSYHLSTKQNFKGTESDEDIEMVNLKDDGDPNKKPEASPVKEASEDEIIQKEGSEKLVGVSSLVSKVSKENIKEISEATYNRNDTAFVTVLTEVTSLQEAEPEGEKFVEAFDTGSDEKSLGTVETVETSLQGEEVESVKLDETCELVSQIPTVEGENTYKESLTVEKLDADEAEEEIRRISHTVSESENQCFEATAEAENRAGWTLAEDKSEEKLQKLSSSLISEERELGMTTTIEKIEDEILTEDETQEKKNLEVPFVMETTEETCLQKEEPRELEASEMGFEDIKENPNEEPKVKEGEKLDEASKLDTKTHIAETKAADSLLERENIAELSEPREKSVNGTSKEEEVLEVGQQKDESEAKKPEKSFGRVCEELETGGASTDMEKNVQEIYGHLKNPEENSEEDGNAGEINSVHDSTENGNPKEENFEAIDLGKRFGTEEEENPNKNTDDLPITHSSVEETSVGGKCEEASNLEPEKIERASESVSEVQSCETSTETEIKEYGDIAKDQDTVSAGNGRVGQSFQEDEKKGEHIEEALSELEGEEDKCEKKTEADENSKNEISTDEITEVKEAAKEPYLISLGEETVKESHKENEMKGKKIEEAATKLDLEDQSCEIKAEEDQGEKKNESNKNAKNGTLNEELSEGVKKAAASDNIEKWSKEPYLVSVGEETVTESHQEDAKKGKQVEEAAAKLDLEDQSDETICRNDTKETKILKEEVKSPDLVLVEPDIETIGSNDKIETVITKDEEDPNGDLDGPPATNSPGEKAPQGKVGDKLKEVFELVPEEPIHETIETNEENMQIATEDTACPEGIMEIEKLKNVSSELAYNPHNIAEGLNLKDQEVQTNKTVASPFAEGSQEELPEKGDEITEDGKSQGLVFDKHITAEVRIPIEEREGKDIKDEVSLKTIGIENTTNGEYPQTNIDASSVLQASVEEILIKGHEKKLNEDKFHKTRRANDIGEPQIPKQEQAPVLLSVEQTTAERCIIDDSEELDNTSNLVLEEQGNSNNDLVSEAQIHESLETKSRNLEDAVSLNEKVDVLSHIQPSGKEISQKADRMELAEANEITQSIEKPEKASDATSEEQTLGEADPTESTETKISPGNKDISSRPQDPVAKTLQKAEVEDQEKRKALETESEVSAVERGGEKRMDDEAQETVDESKPMDTDMVSLSDLVQRSTKKTLQMDGHLTEDKKTTVGKKEMQTEDAETVQVEEAKTNEEDKDDEGEEENEHKKEVSGSDDPVMVEASRDVDVKPMHKKSHNIFSGVGSKVKHSIAKVKKAITCTSSYPKPLSPK